MANGNYDTTVNSLYNYINSDEYSMLAPSDYKSAFKATYYAKPTSVRERWFLYNEFMGGNKYHHLLCRDDSIFCVHTAMLPDFGLVDLNDGTCSIAPKHGHTVVGNYALLSYYNTKLLKDIYGDTDSKSIITKLTINTPIGTQEDVYTPHIKDTNSYGVNTTLSRWDEAGEHYYTNIGEMR